MNKKILALSALIATAALVFVSCEADAGYGSASSEFAPTNSQVVDPSEVGDVPEISSSSGKSGSSSSVATSGEACNVSSVGYCIDGVAASECTSAGGTSLSSCPKNYEETCSSGNYTFYIYSGSITDCATITGN